jgi:hypothetical protein
MTCRYLRFDDPLSPGEEWVPMGLREGTCMLRKSDPRRWAAELRRRGVDVEDDNILCLHNLDANWECCPFCSMRGPHKRTRKDVARNAHGYPLQI